MHHTKNIITQPMKKNSPAFSRLTAAELREALHMTQEHMALFFGVDRTTYAQWEIGRRRMPARVRTQMLELMAWLNDQSDAEARARQEQFKAHETVWHRYYLGRLYQLTEELDRVRARRDDAARLYQLRAAMMVKINSAEKEQEKLRSHIHVFCELAGPLLRNSVTQNHLEEMLRLELAVSTLQFQIRQLKQWVVGQNKKQSNPTTNAVRSAQAVSKATLE